MAKRILITGAFGQLGEAVIEELYPHFDLLATSREIPSKFLHLCPRVKLDVTQRKEVYNVVRKFDPDVIAHFAAYTDVDGCEIHRERAWNVNVRGTEHLIASVRLSKCKFVLISSDYVFDGQNGPYDESATANPINYYGKTKLAAENVVRGSANPWVILRTNILYGASSRSEASFVQWVVSSLQSAKTIRVVSDQWGNPTWTGGLAEAVKMAIVLGVRGIFHYGGAEFLSRYQFARKIAKVYDLDPSPIEEIKTEELNQPAPRPLKSGLKTEKIEEVLGLRTYEVEYCLRKVKEGIII